MKNIIITRTKLGKTKEAREADAVGFDKLTLVNIRNWRTRQVVVDNESYEVHDEEWTLVSTDGDLVTFSDGGLDVFKDQIGAGWFKAEVAA